MSLTRKDVEKVSLLARLRLSEAELETMTPQLDKIVHFVEQLNELNTADVQPMAHALDLHNVFAADEVRPAVPGRPRSLPVGSMPVPDWRRAVPLPPRARFPATNRSTRISNDRRQTAGEVPTSRKTP